MITPNIAFENELFFQYLRDPDSVSPEWREYFERINGIAVHPLQSQSGQTNGHSNAPRDYSKPLVSQSNGFSYSNDSSNYSNNNSKNDVVKLADFEILEPLSSISAKIAENMEESLSVPTATSFRTIPVKALDENRRIINKYLEKQKRKKVSFSQILLWAIVKALAKYPRMNDAFAKVDGKPHRRVRNSINIGVAIDLTRKDGTRLLMVPSIKDSQKMHFSEFIDTIEDLITKARNNKLTIEDLEGTTVTLTNPGMMGTNASSPRLMKGQGLIIAAGSIDYPVEFQSVRPDTLTELALSKVVTMTSTYDHRIIQGAESAEFLAYLHKLLVGEYHFYDQIFASLKIPFEPLRWQSDAVGGRLANKNISNSLDKATYVQQLINAFRVRGHLLANINPLGLDGYSYPELDPAYYGLNIWDLDREFPVDSHWGYTPMPLRDIIEILRETYTGTIGIEYMHIQDTTKKDWIKVKVESTRNQIKFSKEEKLQILKKLVEAETYETFVHTKFVGQKRFSLEGSEALISLVDRIFDEAADDNLDSIVLGMAHRGRLNVLINNVGKKLEQVFNEFEGEYGFDTEDGVSTGDVKYHLGYTGVHTNKSGKSVKVQLAPNPSHLEIINPVVVGMARALEDEMGDKTLSKVMPLLLHGDAAFAGQGISQELLNMSQLEGYKVGGTIHVVINNQIGFTTSSEFSRSTTYCTDVAKMSQVPILHVNGNDPEAVAIAAIFAVEYRNIFNDDVVIDLLGYRKYGHNEGDEPSYTQPLLYKKIRSLSPVRDIYEKELLKSNQVTSEEVAAIHNEFKSKLNAAFDSRKANKLFIHLVNKYKFGQTFKDYNTNVNIDTLKQIGNAITTYPESLNANPKVVGMIKKRKEMLESQTPMIDWSMAEAMAFGALLQQGKNVRLSGEDSRRGTFSQRHAVLIDFLSEYVYIPLNNISPNQAKLGVYDSPLSELGVMGYDYGYSVSADNTLTLWEAQFGDFANMAQPIIDQFLACSEVKWGQTSNLVLLLPHGQEGQGPEHSSARMERYLQLCADENMIVGNFSTPAQYYHAIIRQMSFSSKVPLVITTPKSLLRHPMAVSSLENLSNDKFHHIFDDVDSHNPSEIKRILLCSGKIYYELLQAKRELGLNHIAILRVEQIYPLHLEMLKTFVYKYQNASEVVWVQEEPKNQGAWSFIAEEIRPMLNGKYPLHYAGRRASASTAPGSPLVHNIEQKGIIDAALNGLFS